MYVSNDSSSVSCPVFTDGCVVGMSGVFSFVSRMVIILGFVVVIRCVSSDILFRMPLILI